MKRIGSIGISNAPKIVISKYPVIKANRKESLDKDKCFTKKVNKTPPTRKALKNTHIQI